MRRFIALALWIASLAGCGARDENENAGPGPATQETCSWVDVDGSSWALTDDDRWAESALATVQADLPLGMVATIENQGRSPGALHLYFRYVAADVPLCDEGARAHRIGERLMFEGRAHPGTFAPAAWTEESLRALSWPSLAETVDAVSASLRTRDVDVVKTAKCWAVDAGMPVPSYDVWFQANGRPYRVLGAGKAIRHLESRSFHITGEARVYRKNPVDGELITVPLPDLLEGTRLRSKRFHTSTPHSFALAESEDRRYIFDPDDERFVETSLFANAERMAMWLEQDEHRFRLRCTPIKLRAHAVWFGGEVNNGEYVTPERSESGRPEIWVGDGDGYTLRNLGVDFDVVAHELGHHVIYRRLRSPYGESGVLHEGIADYLVFAHTGDACLGESICPAGSEQCALPERCLRTAENMLRLDAPDLPLSTHKRSQLISGLLWDLGKVVEIGQAGMASLVIGAIDYLGARSGYLDFIKALMAADLERHGGRHACIIRDGALARGFGSLLNDVDCATYQAGHP